MTFAVEKIQQIIRGIAMKFDPDRIIPFGSYARGEAGPDRAATLLVYLGMGMMSHDLTREKNP